MKKVLIVIFILSMVDIILTYAGIKAGVIEEANPLLREMFRVSPEIAALLVTIFVGGMLYIVARFGRRFRYINIGLGVILAAKILILYAHFNWIRQVI